jgi:glycosyltransferase involved in cell wall biosynthesis
MAADGRPVVLIVGPVPPPAFGVAKATRLMLDSPVLAERLSILHLDTSDTRGLANIGRFDWANVFLAFRHTGRLALLVAKKRPALTVLTASQGTLGLMRDALLATTSRALGSPVVIYLRGSGYADLQATEGWLAMRILRYLVKGSSLVVVLGESLVGMAHAVDPRAKVAVVPNGCPPAVPVEQRGMRDGDHPLVVYIGRLARPKGLNQIVEATRSVAASVPELEVVLRGEWEPPEYETEIRELVARSDLNDVVRFDGPVSGGEKADLLARAWALLLPSHSEGHPWVILEAMSAGVPVVATDTGAIAETVQDGVAGFVIPVGDADMLASRTIALLTDGALWEKISRCAVERHARHYTMEESHRRLADELCRVAEQRRSRQHD